MSKLYETTPPVSTIAVDLEDRESVDRCLMDFRQSNGRLKQLLGQLKGQIGSLTAGWEHATRLLVQIQEGLNENGACGHHVNCGPTGVDGRDVSRAQD